jgi:alkylated DNA nucleotide flippase Atl1
MVKGKSSKSWREKLEKNIEPKLVPVPEKWGSRIGYGQMLIPSPLLVDAVVRKIPKGKLATVNIIREYLANKFNADITCPLTTGIFLNIAANAAEEDKAKGKTKISPWWRVLKEGGKLNPKFPGGVEQQAAYLNKEGFKIITGKSKDKLFVKDYEKNLQPLF